MKKLLSLLLFLYTFHASFGQGVASLSTTQSFTTATSGAVIPNNFTTSGGPVGSVGFRMTYYIQPGSGTVSALSVELDGAATSGGSYSALTPAVGGGSGSGSTLNPVTTSPTGQNNLCCDFEPFLKIKVNTITVATGTPILVVKILGYAGTSAAAGSGGGGGSGITQLTQDVLAGPGSGSVAATVVGIDTVPLCSGFSPSNGQFLKYTTGGTPNPCYSAAASGGGSFVLLEEHTASASAALNFTTCFTTTYDTYQLELVNLVPATNSTDLILQVSTNGGSTYDAGANYGWAEIHWLTVAIAQGGNTGDTSVSLTGGFGLTPNTASQGGVIGTWKIYNPLSGTAFTRMTGTVDYEVTNVSADVGVNTAASYLQTTAVNAFRILAVTGNLTSGTARCYGLAK